MNTIVKVGVFCVVAALLFAGVSCGRKGDEGGRNDAVPVAIAVVREGSVSDVLSLTGNIEAAADVDLYSKVAGRLEELKKDVGDAVKRGEVIARIDDKDIEARLNQARAALDVARAELKKAGADLYRADKDRGRALKLFEDGVESETIFDQADAAYKVALAAYELAESNIWNREAYLDQVGILHDETRLKSPVDGFVARRYVDPGAMIALSTPILKVVRIDTVDVVISVPEVKLAAITVGSPATIKVDAYPRESFSGTVSRISPWVDLKTRSSEVEVTIENPEHHLKPGMFARVGIELEHRKGVPLIPKDSILLVGNSSAVYIVDGDVARVKKIRTGLEKGNIVEVIEGLEEGQKIIVRGQSVVADGKRVEIVREEEIL